MRILIKSGCPAVLVEPGDFKRFHVETAGHLPFASLDAALEGLGYAEAGDVFIDANALKQRLAKMLSSEGWHEQYDGMLSFARKSGWSSKDGTKIRAHVVVSDDVAICPMLHLKTL
jgi:hypothetical protein